MRNGDFKTRIVKKDFGSRVRVSGADVAFGLTHQDRGEGGSGYARPHRRLSWLFAHGGTTRPAANRSRTAWAVHDSHRCSTVRAAWTPLLVRKFSDRDPMRRGQMATSHLASELHSREEARLRFVRNTSRAACAPSPGGRTRWRTSLSCATRRKILWLSSHLN
jgi:hypothetical protein